MAIEVVKPGLGTSVQDLGRPGYYHLGIPLSGGMDRYSLRAANLLVGNDEGDAVLEAVFMGPELRFTEARTIAITGADLPPKPGGIDVPVVLGSRSTYLLGALGGFEGRALKAGDVLRALPEKRAAREGASV